MTKATETRPRTRESCRPVNSFYHPRKLRRLHDVIHLSYLFCRFSIDASVIITKYHSLGNGMLASLKLKRPSIFISESLREGQDKAKFAEQLKERAALFGGTQ